MHNTINTNENELGGSTRPHAAISRRAFLAASAAGAALSFGGSAQAKAKPLPDASASKLPRWKGFNLLEKFNGQNGRFVESDFEWSAEWGFNFARLPMDYRMWIEADDWTRFREETLKEIDEAVTFGERYGVHIMMNFHRAPGYTVAQPAEAKNVWKDEEAQRVCALHWRTFAKRYKGISSSRLSFNLFNEPGLLTGDVYRSVVQKMVEAIRAEDESRLVVCDGRNWGRTPPIELAGLGVAAATRGYDPMRLTHYKAGWVDGADSWPEPTYPLHRGDEVLDKAKLRDILIKPWSEVAKKGIGICVGEFGCFNKTPHDVVLHWMRDCLSLWKDAGWGWALWNLRGGFGILDSERADVKYESWRGRQLDRAMLDLLRADGN